MWLNWIIRRFCLPSDPLKQMLDEVVAEPDRAAVESFYAAWINGAGFEVTIDVGDEKNLPSRCTISFYHEPIDSGSEWSVAEVEDLELATVAIAKDDLRVYFYSPNWTVDDSVTRIQLAPSLAKFIADVNGNA